MRLVRHAGAAAFLADAGAWLGRAEAANGLLLGVASRLAASPPAGPAPYFATVLADGGTGLLAAAMRTPPHGIVLTEAPAAAAALLADDAFEAYDDLPGVLAPAEAAWAFARRYARLAGARPREGRRQRVHALYAVTDLPPAPGVAGPAVPAEFPTLTAWAADFHRELGLRAETAARAQVEAMARDGRLFVWRDPEPVSMAAAVAPTPNGERITFVYTPPARRCRGYATALVADLSRRLLAEGCRFCFLYTDLDNPVSNRIYARIGYRPVQDVVQVELE